MTQRFPQSLRHLSCAVLLAFVLTLTFLGFGETNVHAAAQVTSHSTVPSTVIIRWSQCGSSDCYGSPGVTYQFLAHWNSGPWFGGVGFTAFWGDGGSNYYLCGFNCDNGYAHFSHFYNGPGTWNTWVGSSATGGYGGSNHVWMHT